MSEANPRNLFYSAKERSFFQSINEELLGEVIQQQIIYYAVSAEETRTNLYGESDSKVFRIPIKMWALVQFDRSTTNFETSQANRDYHVRVKFRYSDLAEKNTYPREGDFLTFGRDVYEVFTILGPRQVVGQPGEEWDTLAECRQSRLHIADIEKI